MLRIGPPQRDKPERALQQSNSRCAGRKFYPEVNEDRCISDPIRLPEPAGSDRRIAGSIGRPFRLRLTHYHEQAMNDGCASGSVG
jgi:hypothetical protein